MKPFISTLEYQTGTPISTTSSQLSLYVNYLDDSLGQIVFIFVTISSVVVQRFQQQSVLHHSPDRLAKSSVQSDSLERDKTKTVVVEQHRAREKPNL